MEGTRKILHLVGPCVCSVTGAGGLSVLTVFDAFKVTSRELLGGEQRNSYMIWLL